MLDQIVQMDLLYDVDVDASVVAVDGGRLVGMALLSDEEAARLDRGWARCLRPDDNGSRGV